MYINQSQFLKILSILLLFTVLSCCNSSSKDEGGWWTIKPGPNAQENVQKAMIEARNGDRIQFTEGTFEFTGTLTMDSQSEIVLQGRGRDKTILSFESQSAGGDGILVSNSDNIIVRDLTIRDTIGDALKFNNSDHIVMVRVGAEWSGEPSSENGGYGLYPVNSSNIIIDDCYVYGASDSGIYVGQSTKAIVRNSLAEGNVAGIEIENTVDADIYDNTVRDNSAGILVFNLPGLSMNGYRTRVFDNSISDNMRGNFAETGSIVSEVPAGTGILVLSTDEVEIFGNTLEGNNVMGTTVGSYLTMVALGLFPEITDMDYEPYPGSVYIHDNSYSRSNIYPPSEEQSYFGNLLVSSFNGQSMPVPDIILDGFLDQQQLPSGSICLERNDGSTFVNLNVHSNFPNEVDFDASAHSCSMDPLPGVEIAMPNF